MKPLNFSLAEALDFDYLTKEEIKEVILEYEHIKNVLEDSLGTSDPDEVIARVDQLEEEVRAAENKNNELLQDIREAYEHRRGAIYDADDEQLVKWVCEDIGRLYKV